MALIRLSSLASNVVLSAFLDIAWLNGDVIHEKLFTGYQVCPETLSKSDADSQISRSKRRHLTTRQLFRR
jgi:hypothetical protein